MKFLHLADLHLGKRVNGFDMLEDQRFILEQILTLCEKHGVEAVVIAGDIYDTPVPPAAACTLLDWFLTQLATRKIPHPGAGRLRQPRQRRAARLCQQSAGRTKRTHCRAFHRLPQAGRTQ